MIEDLVKFVNLAAEKRELEDKLKEVKDAIDMMEPEILEFFTENGIQNMNVESEGGDRFTVYIKQDIRATFLKTEEAFTVLEEQGLKDALTTTVNPQRASAIVREAIGDSIDGSRPEWVNKAFSVFEGFKAAVRKS